MIELDLGPDDDTDKVPVLIPRHSGDRRVKWAPPREMLWQWVATAPLPVVLFICLTTTSMLAGWVWNVAAEVREQQTVAAVAASEARAAKEVAVSAESRLARMEDKLDWLKEAVAEMKANHNARRSPSKEKVK